MRESVKLQFSTFKSKGEYNIIEMEYDAILEGDVDAVKLQSNGASKIRGNVKAVNLILNGVGDVIGNCKCGDIEIHGESKIIGNIRGRKMYLDGKLKNEGKMKINEFILNGTLNTNEYLEGENITGNGTIIVPEVRGENIELRLSKKSKITTITGKKINIENKPISLFSKIIASGNTFIERIEGEDVELKNIDADLVIGKNITIGEECNVKEVRQL